MLEKFTSTLGGKIAIAVLVVLAVGLAIFSALKMSSSDDGRTANDADVKAAAKKQIDQIQNNSNLPPALKQEMLARQQGLMNGGKGTSAPTAPPTGQ